MKILFVGLGSIGQRHLRNLPRLGTFEYIALRSTRRPLPDEFSEIPMTVVSRLEDAIAARPDVAFLCAPPLVQQAVLGPLVRDTRCHFLIEKPIAPSLDGLADYVRLLEEQQRKSLVGYNLRFHPVSAVVRDALGRRALGKVCSVRASVGQYLPDWHPSEDYREGYSANTRLGGGVLLDLIHEIDLVCSWFGKPETVKAMAGTVSALEIDTEDTAALVCGWADGMIGCIQLDYVQRVPSRNGTIVGDAATLTYDLMKSECRIERPGADPDVSAFPGFVRNEMYVAEVAHLFDAIRTGSACSPSLGEGVDSLDVALRAKRDAGLLENDQRRMWGT
jgi:predicted dehydrogenase